MLFKLPSGVDVYSVVKDRTTKATKLTAVPGAVKGMMFTKTTDEVKNSQGAIEDSFQKLLHDHSGTYCYVDDDGVAHYTDPKSF